MRDPNRMHSILEKITQVWKTYPDLRLSQLLLNLDIDYNTEDDELLKRLNDAYIDRK